MELRLLRYFVAVADERHVGRAASRLGMTQPPLSRAMRQLEVELGAALLERTPRGVELTGAGTALYREAWPILDRADRLPARVAGAAGKPTITVGTCADTADQLGSRLVREFRRQNPTVGLILRETDLTDPTAGLRADVVDVALTRAPFDETNIATHPLRSDPIGVVVLDDDPLAHRASVSTSELDGRQWIRLPEGTDPIWSAYWRNDAAQSAAGDRPIVRTIQESLQSVLWNNASTFAPLNQALPDGLTNVPVIDKTPSQLVIAWKNAVDNPFVRSFVDIAVANSRRHATPS